MNCCHLRVTRSSSYKVDGELQTTARGGFALVVTISMMVLLVVVAVGLLSLSSVALRSASLGSAEAEAQANARMALMLALAELQQQAGPDMRVTAPADILDEDNPPLTGVWRSWEGSDHEQSGSLVGRPIQPDYDSKELSNAADDNGRFLSWLVSGSSGDDLPGDAANLVSRVESEDTIPLVSSGSLAGDDGREVHVVPVTVDERGAYAWWVSGENQKARVPRLYEPKGDDAVGWVKHNLSSAVADPSVFELDALLADASLADRIFTLNTADLAADAGAAIKPSQSFHDLSASSVGLLTNVATGGWRKDLSLLSESWENQPYEGLGLFRLTAGEDVAYTRPEPVNTMSGNMPPEHIVPGSVFYPWSDYRQPSGAGERSQVIHCRAPVSSWTSLINHATIYKKAQIANSGAPAIDVQSWKMKNLNGRSDRNTFSGLHQTWVVPQMARLQLIASHYATRDYEAGDANRLRPAVLFTPVVTLWNPYNYELRFPNNYFYLRFGKSMPIALKYDFLTSDYWSVQRPWSNDSYAGRRMTTNGGIHMRFEGTDLVLKPGETRVFSPAAGELHDETYVGTVDPSSLGPNMSMQPGVRYGVGYYFGLDVMMRPDILENGRNSTGRSGILSYIQDNVDPMDLTLPPGTMLSPSARFDVVTLGSGAGFPADVCGLSAEWNIDSQRNPDHGIYWAMYAADQADELFPPMLDLASASLAQCENEPAPFLSMIFGSQIASRTHTPTKGMAQSSPLVRFCASGGRSYFAERYPGMSNLLNSPWAFSFAPHTAGPGDDLLPNADNDTFNGYIVTGFRKADGIDRLVLVDLPSRPISSLAELTNWHLRGHNPAPPHGHNLIGNSDANPLISSDNVVNSANNPHADTRYNEQQDDSYCANHLLFDDWFFSSVAPEPDAIGPQGKSLRENYLEFLTGADPLANRAYRPIADDVSVTMSDADEVYSEQVEPLDSWESIASRLEVDGMFNVNSTSVKAWRALLGHARNQKIPYLTSNGAIGLSEQTDFAIPRSSVAGYDEAGNTVSGTYYATTEFAGYRVFSSEMLDQFADNIVEQIRLRGPFLSLSEFVNRQLSDDEDLAVGGAIQVALNKLSEDPQLNPFEVLQNESSASVGDPAGQDDYVFREAAEGYSAFGLPGWSRQADVLRNLAPILSARDDTFTIRAYGEARDAEGKVTASAWCEATVQRIRNFCDPVDEADTNNPPVAPSNQIFGRKFIMTSFRWLNASEV